MCCFVPSKLVKSCCIQVSLHPSPVVTNAFVTNQSREETCLSAPREDTESEPLPPSHPPLSHLVENTFSSENQEPLQLLSRDKVVPLINVRGKHTKATVEQKLWGCRAHQKAALGRLRQCLAGAYFHGSKPRPSSRRGSSDPHLQLQVIICKPWKQGYMKCKNVL